MIKQTLDEVKKITELLIRDGMSINQNFPIVREEKIITWANQTDISVALRSVSYTDIYNELDEDKNYSIKMLDGALIQMMYSFTHKGSLVAHRLAYFPSPSKEQYDKRYEEYEEIYFGECLYHDIIVKNVVTFPIRFDYSNDITKYVELVHPKSHLHLGQYEHCRIPVCAPMPPHTFINFLLRNFYYKAFERMGMIKSTLNFERCLSANEANLLHFNIT